jgi:hypothetical protein
MILFDKNLEAKFQCVLPLAVVAPVSNRIIREVPQRKLDRSSEPWYAIIAHCIHQKVKFNRAPAPEGETSLYGTRYIAEKEPPPRVIQHPEPHVMFFTVIINDYQKELFRGHFSVDDLFHHGAEFVARSLVEKGRLNMSDGPFYYKVEVGSQYVSTIERDLLPQEAFEVEGVFHLPKQEEERKRLTFTKVASPPLKAVSRSKFGEAEIMGRGKKERGAILIRPAVYRDLLNIGLSKSVEDGGYLLGIPYRTTRSPESEEDPNFKWIIEITDLIKAEKSYGTPLLLLFNGDTWSRMRQTVDRDFSDKKLLSWFHTHLFAASDDFGLSGLDVDLHRQYFSRPWHVAILINIDAQDKREVRCFQKNQDGDLVECKFEVLKN